MLEYKDWDLGVEGKLGVGVLLYTDWSVGVVANSEGVLQYRDWGDGAAGGGGTFE